MAESGLIIVIVYRRYLSGRDSIVWLPTTRGMEAAMRMAEAERRQCYLDHRADIPPEHIVFWPVGGEPATLAQIRGI